MPGIRGRVGMRPLTTDKQRAQIERRGQMAWVSPCLICPCLLAEAQPDPNCGTCKGTGRFYPPALAYATMILAVQEQSQLTYQEAGTWMPGTLQATLPPELTVAENDLVRLVDIKDVFNEVLVRGLDDTLLFSSGVEVLYVMDRETQYRAGIDYQMESTSSLSWLPDGQAPAFGKTYSVRYKAHPDYLVSPDSPRLRVEHRHVQSSVVILHRLHKLGLEVP